MGDELKQDVVHIWLASPERVRDPGLWEAYLRILDDHEAARYARLRPPESRREFLLAHALKRVCLSHYSSVKPSAWRFSTGLHGRPEIAAPHNDGLLRFNISHTSGLVACGLTVAHDLGVDVECTGRMMSFREVALQQFAPAEVEALRHLPAELQRERFYDFWTLKEAYIKALGDGLSLPLNEFSFSLEADDSVHLQIPSAPRDESRAWQFLVYSPTHHHRLSLAVRGGEGAQILVQIYHFLPLTRNLANTPPEQRVVLTGGKRI